MSNPATWISSQGTTFSFAGATFKCIDISQEGSAPSRERVDLSTLDLADGSEKVYANAPLKEPADPKKVTIQFRAYGTATGPTEGAEGTLTTTGGSGTYRCTASSISRKTGAFVEGSATFEQVLS
jgi:hypothetical protein